MKVKGNILELQALNFNVNTEQLLKAKNAIDDLSAAMSGLNKVQQEESKTSKTITKDSEEITKAKSAESKSVAGLEKLISNLANTYRDLANGMTRGESAILNTARSLGATTSQLAEVETHLKNISTLTKNPFDASLGAIRSISQELEQLNNRARLAGEGVVLNSKHLSEFGKIATEVRAKMAGLGMDVSSEKGLAAVDKQIADTERSYISLVKSVNSRIDAEKSIARAERDRVNALRNVQSAEERIFATVAHVNDGLSQNATLNERAALAVGSYERNLRLAGIAGEEAASRLQKFKAAQATITASENKRMGEFIARGVGVQVGDIGVSLASGQNPLIVMIQQLDQVRGLLQQAGRDGLDLKNVMNDATSQIVKSFKDVGIAVGAFIGGAFKTLGNGLYDLLNNFFDVQKAALGFGNILVKLGADPIDALDAVTSSLGLLRNLFTLLSGAAVAFSVALVTSFFQVLKSSDELAKSLSLFGAAQGLSFEQAKVKAQELSTVTKITFTSAMRVVSDFTKSGITDMTLYGKALVTATSLQKVFGIATSDTAKAYKDLQDKPYENLLKIAKETGNVSVETLKNVKALEDQGRAIEAAKLATEEYSRAMQQTASDADASISDIAKLWRTIKEEIAGVIAKIQELADGRFWVTLEVSLLGIVYLFKQLFASVGFANAVSKLDFSGAEDALRMLSENTETYGGKISNTWNRVAESSSAAIKAANSESAASFSRLQKVMDQFKAKNDPKTMSLQSFVAAGIGKASAEAGQVIVGQDFKTIKDALTKQWQDANKPDKSVIKDAIAAARKTLENQIADIQRAAKEEETIYKNRLVMIETFNKQGLMSIEDYYGTQKNAIEDWLKTQTAAIDKEKEIYESAKNKAKTQKDVADIQGKINALVDKQAENETKVATTISELDVKKQESLKNYKRLQDDVNAQVLELAGNLREAAAIRFDNQYQELYNKAVAEGNIELQNQIKLLRVAAIARSEGRQTVGEVVTGLERQGPIANENLAVQQQAYNMAMQQGIISSEVYKNKLAGIAAEAANIKNAMGFGDATSIATAGLGKSLSGFTTVAQGIADSIGTVFSSLTDGISNSMAAAIVSGEDFGEVMRNLAQNVLQEFLSSLIKIGIQYVLNQSLGITSAQTTAAAQIASTTAVTAATTAGIATTTAASTAAAAETATAWTPAALWASIGSFGQAAVIAGGAIMAVMALGGFSEGGYTGAGGKYQPAGVVHKGEVVWSQEDIARAGGVGVVEQLRKGGAGFADGGIVSPSFAQSTLPSSMAKSSNSSIISVSIENYGSSKDFEVQQLSETEVRIIARDEAINAVKRETPNVIAQQIKNPNSSVSKSLSQNTQTQRRR